MQITENIRGCEERQLIAEKDLPQYSLSTASVHEEALATAVRFPCLILVITVTHLIDTAVHCQLIGVTGKLNNKLKKLKQS